MHRSSPDFPAQVASIEDLVQQLNAELFNIRLHQINESLIAACADTKQDHPSQIVFAALKYQLMFIFKHINAATTEQAIEQTFNELISNFIRQHLVSYINFSRSEIAKNEALKKRLGIASVEELSAEKLYKSLSEYKQELFNITVEVYRQLALQYLALQKALVNENEFDDRMTEIVEGFRRDVRGITSQINPYKATPLPIGIYTPTKYDLIEGRLQNLDNEVQAGAYLEQVRAQVNAEANNFNQRVNELNIAQSQLFKRAEILRKMYAGIQQLLSSDDASTEVIKKNIEQYDRLYKELQDDIAEQQKNFSNKKKELLEQGNTAFKSLQKLNVDDIELPAINDLSITQQQIIIDIDALIAELRAMQKDDSKFKEKLDEQTTKNNELFKEIQPRIERRLLEARAAYLACEPKLQKAAADLAKQCLGQTYYVRQNPLWVAASDCAKAQLLSENYTQSHRALVADNTSALIDMVEVSAVNAKEKLASRFIENATNELERIHREYDTAIGELQSLRNAAMQKIALHLKDKANAELPTIKQEAINKFELSLELLKQLKPVNAADLNVPNSEALRKANTDRDKQIVRDRPRHRSASFSMMRGGMKDEPHANVVEAEQQPSAKPGFFKRHPWVKPALIGLGVGLLLAGLVIGGAAITVATMGAGAPAAVAAVFGVGGIIGAKCGLVGAAATGVGFGIVAGSAGAAGAFTGVATQAVVNRCRKPHEQQEVVVAPVVNPVQQGKDVAPAASSALPIRQKVVRRGISSSLDIDSKRVSHLFPRARVSNTGLFKFNALPEEEQTLIARFEIALAKEIYRLIWNHNLNILTRLQEGVKDKNSAIAVIEKNLAGDDTRGRVLQGIQNTIASDPEFATEFGNLGEFAGHTMADLDAYLHGAYQAKHALAH